MEQMEMMRMSVLAVLLGVPVSAGAVDTYDRLGLQNGESVQMADEEAAEASSQAVEGFDRQIEMSDPETRDAILKAQKELQEKSGGEGSSEPRSGY